MYLCITFLLVYVAKICKKNNTAAKNFGKNSNIVSKCLIFKSINNKKKFLLTVKVVKNVQKINVISFFCSEFTEKIVILSNYKYK